MYRISDHVKHRIVALCEEGVSVSDIADELGITVNLTENVKRNLVQELMNQVNGLHLKSSRYLRAKISEVQLLMEGCRITKKTRSDSECTLSF